MHRTFQHAARLALILTVSAGLSACERREEGPQPQVTASDPQVVCGQQITTEVILTGSGFSPAPVDALTDSPRMAIPQLTLARTGDLDGSALSGDPIVLNPDPTSPEDQRVVWSSQSRMRFRIGAADESLALAELVLERGLYDVTISNATGGEDTLVRAFTSVPPPVLTSARPTPICTAQYANTITVEGEWFLTIGGVLPTVTIGEQAYTPESAEGCEAVATPRGDVERCTTLTVVVAEDDVGPGAWPVVVTNPDPAGCQSTEAVVLHVAPPPAIEAVTPQPMCLAQGARTLTVSGSGFLDIDGQRPAVAIGGAQGTVEAMGGCEPIAGLETVSACSELTVTLATDALEPGIHDVIVTNPESAQCRSEEAITFTVVPPPTLAAVVPQPVCTAQGQNTLTLTGTGFLAIGETMPAVTIGGVSAGPVAVADADCAAVAGVDGVRACTTVTVTVDQELAGAGVHDVVVLNPDPAGCSTQETVTLAVVAPPSVTEVAPNPVCVAQGDIAITVTGTGFLHDTTTGALPELTLGTGGTATVTGLEACTAVPGAEGFEQCTMLLASVTGGGLVEGTDYPVTVINPAPAACASTEAVILQVAPPPDVTGIDPTQICSGGGTFTITGSNLEGVTARLYYTETDYIEASTVVVSDDGTSAVTFFGSGLPQGTYTLHVLGAGGCSDSLSTPIEVTLGPVVYYVDPPTVYNAVSIRATIYASGVTSAPSAVEAVPAGGGTATALTDIVVDGNTIQATIPAGLDAGSYDVFLRDVGGCDAFLADGLSVVAEPTIALLGIDPTFGEAETNVAMSLQAEATASLAAGEVNFQPTPRVYVSSATGTAAPVRAVAFETEERLTAVMPPLPAGVYDLVVVNPDGSVGFLPAAYEATSVPPPFIEDVTPSRIEASAGQILTISGASFLSPEVTLECSNGAVLTAAVVGTETLLTATVNASTAAGAACVVRVTNTAEGTWDEWSALSVTNPAGNLSSFTGGGAMNVARRALGLAVGRATQEARFLYAVGGDEGDHATALSSVETAPLGRFGEVGTWRVLGTALPEARTMATLSRLGRFLYLIGGLRADGTPTAQILRAQILDPLASPDVTGVDLRFAESGTGLPAGSWTYVVSAVLDATDLDNPAGETLPSEPLTIYAPNIPNGVEIDLTWTPVPNAALYRIYRTVAVNGAVEDLRLLDTTSSSTFTDTNPAAFLDLAAMPLALGALGEWHPAAASLNTPRALYGFAEVNEPGCTRLWYVVNGLSDTATETDSYEVAIIGTDAAGQPTLGGFTQHTATGTGTLTYGARREIGAWVASQQNSAASLLTACEFYLYAGPGAAGTLASPGDVTSVRVAKVADTATGVLGSFENGLNTGAPASIRGYSAFFSGNFAYALGGWQGAGPSNATLDGQLCGTGASVCPEPKLVNFNSSGVLLGEARYLYGYARVGAFSYLAGGLSTAGVSATTEFNVR